MPEGTQPTSQENTADDEPTRLVNALIADGARWAPPASVTWNGGMWCGAHEPSLSYPDDGQLATDSGEPGWWFEARAQLIAGYLAKSQVEGSIWDVGGGNGTMAQCLSNRGCPPVVVVEPMRESAKRAIPRGAAVFACTLAEVGLPPESLPAAMLLDVIEHVRDPVPLLRQLRPLLVPSGPLIVTVPAHRSLWSNVDIAGGHYRRYSRGLLRTTLEAGGFRLTAMRHVFQSLYLPALFARRLQSHRSGAANLAADRQRLHPNALVERSLRYVTAMENRVPDRLAAPFGTSLLAVAQPRQ
mgnify:FL=1